MPTNILCLSTFCGLPARHVPECPGPTEGCRGCQPAQAADGLRLCGRCTTQIGTDAITLAQLHTDLGEVMLYRRRGDGPGGTSTGAPVPDEDVIRLRETIRALLAGLVQTITSERGIHGPHEWYLHRLPPGVAGPRARRRRDVNTPATDAAFIARHQQWLAARRDAGDVATDLRTVAVDWRGKALAYPSRSARLFLGHCPLVVTDLDGHESVCGERLYHKDGQPFVQCPGCSTEETVEQWQHWLVPTTTALVDAYAAAADLSLRWCRPVDPTMIRQWASRGRVEPVWEPNPAHPAGRCAWCPHPEDPGTCPRTRRPSRVDRRVQYALEALRAYARSIWGDEPRLPGRARTLSAA